MKSWRTMTAGSVVRPYHRFQLGSCASCCLLVGLLLLSSGRPISAVSPVLRLRLVVTTPLPFENTPLDPDIDFAAWIRRAGVAASPAGLEKGVKNA